MVGKDASGPPLEEAAGAAGPHVTDAFKLLSDETRLAILLALWEAYDPRADRNVVSFTNLYERVNLEDSGNFSYHLDKLVGHFVDQEDQGYRLTNAGHRIVRAVIAGAGLEERTLPPTEIPRSCHWCDAPVKICFEDQRLYQVCTGCQGNLGPHSDLRAPEGTLAIHDGFNPAGLVGRTPEEVFVAGTIEYHRATTLVIRGVCPECSGPVEESLRICEDHDSPPGEVCPTCGTWNEVRAVYVCEVCKHNISYPAWVSVLDHPAIVSFYYDQGFTVTYGLEDPESAGRLWERLFREQELVSKDPVRILVKVEDGGQRLDVTLDGELSVVDIEGPKVVESRAEVTASSSR